MDLANQAIRTPKSTEDLRPHVPSQQEEEVDPMVHPWPRGGSPSDSGIDHSRGWPPQYEGSRCPRTALCCHDVYFSNNWSPVFF